MGSGDDHPPLITRVTKLRVKQPPRGYLAEATTEVSAAKHAIGTRSTLLCIVNSESHMHWQQWRL